MTWQAEMNRFVAMMLRVLGMVLAAPLSMVSIAAEEPPRVRESALAGTWYPADADELGRYVDGLLNQAKPPEPPLEGTLRALILPHAGYLYSGATAATGVALLRGASYRRVIVLAPSHRGRFRGLSIAEVDAYETPLGRVPLDTQAVAELRRSPLVVADPQAHQREHAIEIELPLLQRTLEPGWRLVPILVGEMRAEDYPVAAELLRPLADEGSLVLVSSDFTHYGPRFGYLPFPPSATLAGDIRRLDEGALAQIAAHSAEGLLDYQEDTGISVCGIRPIAVLLQMLPASARTQTLAYATSGEITGDWLNSVSYAVVAVTHAQPLSAAEISAIDTRAKAEPPPLTEAELRLLHRLAVAGVTWAVRGEDSLNGEGGLDRLLAGLPSSLQRPAGAFVTLKRQGALRGCIGTIGPRSPVSRAVFENGVNAARNDRRFRPLTADELGDLEVEVSVLSEPRPIGGPEQFRVGEQGVILKKDGRQAVFLPEVATEQGWSREETLTHLARKAGLPGDAWQQGAELEVFHSEKFTAPYPPGPESIAVSAGTETDSSDPASMAKGQGERYDARR